jgi:hypothetical protein
MTTREEITRKIISDTIGFNFDPNELQMVNADDLMRLADAIREDGGRRDALLDSQYRAGAKAGWNAAHLPDGERAEAIANLIEVKPGDMAAFRDGGPVSANGSCETKDDACRAVEAAYDAAKRLMLKEN